MTAGELPVTDWPTAWKLFLTDTAPNVPKRFPALVETERTFGNTPDKRFVAVPDIDLYCHEEDAVRRFRVTSPDRRLLIHNVAVETVNSYNFITFQCKNCSVGRKTMALMFGGIKADGATEVMKVGEFPPFGAPITKRLRKFLGTQVDLFEKGWKSERVGLGIGAAAYYRRIVEMKWHELIESLRAAAVTIGVDSATVGLFDDALKQTQFVSAVASLKNALPPKLYLTGNVNPLTLLHSSLSKDLHNASDEECLEVAGATRKVLEAMLTTMANVQTEHDELAEAVKKLIR